jgi:integrase
MLFKRRNNAVWQADFTIRGQRVSRSTRVTSFKAAKEIELNWKSRLMQNLPLDAEKPKQVPTFAEFSKRVVAYAEARNSDSRWMRFGVAAISKYKPLADARLDTITSETVSGFQAWRRAAGKAVATINREGRILRRCLRLAVEWGALERCPRVSMVPGERGRERVVSPREFETFALHCAQPLADFAVLLNETGLRPSEAHRLSWEDVTFVNGRYGLLKVRYGKSKAARRELPLTPRLRAVLESRWQNQHEPDSGFVFPQRDTKSGHVEHSSFRKQHRAR